MRKGKVCDAINWLQGIVLHPNTTIQTPDGKKTVFDLLKEKHPNTTQRKCFPLEVIFSLPPNMNELPHLQQLTVTNEFVEKSSRRLQGGGDPTGSTSEQWKYFLLLNVKYLYNTCNGNSELIIHGTGDMILSREGVIQGGPLSMPLCMHLPHYL